MNYDFNRTRYVQAKFIFPLFCFSKLTGYACITLHRWPNTGECKKLICHNILQHL